MNVVAIDPAARRFAYAIFHDGVLHACGYGSTPGKVSHQLDDARQYTWILEVPRNYTSFAVAHKDLDRLRRTLRQLEKVQKARGDDVVRVPPNSWKGNVPKTIHHHRCWAILSEAERVRLPDSPDEIGYAHDVHDAVALGLTQLGRIGRGGRRRRTRR
jgi:hypothetical protein